MTQTLNAAREAAFNAIMGRILSGKANLPAEKTVRSRAIVSIELATSTEVDRIRFMKHLERMKLVILNDQTDQHSQRLTVGSRWTAEQFAGQLSELAEIASQLGISAAICPVLTGRRG
jgi:hypothetical protein